MSVRQIKRIAAVIGSGLFGMMVLEYLLGGEFLSMPVLYIGFVIIFLVSYLAQRRKTRIQRNS